MLLLSPAYIEIRRQRSVGNIAAALEALQLHRPAGDAEAFEAVICLFVSGQIDNAVHVSQTFPWSPKGWAADAARALVASIETRDPTDELEAAERAALAPDASPDAAALYLLFLQQSGQLERAEAFIDRRFPNPPNGETLLLTMIAEVMLALGRWREAYRAATGVVSMDPDDLRSLFVLSEVSLQIGNFHEALGHAVRLHHLQKGTPPAVLQLMRCRNRLGQYYGTLAAYDGLPPDTITDPGLHMELGRAYAGLGDGDKAIAEFRNALPSDVYRLQALRSLLILQASGGDGQALEQLNRSHGELIENDSVCLYWIGIAALNGGALDDAQRSFEQTARLAEARGAALQALPWPVPEPRLRHDREQLELLNRRGKLDPAGKAAFATLCSQKGGSAPDSVYAPEGDAAEALAHALCTTFHRPQAQWDGRALGGNDYRAIESEYRTNRVVVIDDFLSPDALAALRTFCEEATIWRMHYARGYVGATLEQGFSPRVLLALAAELRAAMPEVLGESPLTQAWGYKYDQRQQGINMHADFADVNVNFWITPDAACEDPDRSGMIVYDLPVPANWTFYEYNNDPEKLAAYVRVHGAKPRRIPYCANRCVLFDSSLIHITDELHFKPGYENRRVNVTLLYGKPRHVD